MESLFRAEGQVVVAEVEIDEVIAVYMVFVVFVYFVTVVDVVNHSYNNRYTFVSVVPSAI